MAVKLPYRSESQVVLPTAIRPYDNGKIPDALLFPCGIRSFKMAEPAARACRAMVAAAAGDGIGLDATGTYRSYEQQVNLFTSRYTTSPQAGRKTKTWNGVKYWQMPGVAMAATPGTSKHGLGVTPDLATRTGAGKLVAVTTETQQWLAAHGPGFGFWNSVKSEAWHWPYFPGDDIPAAVLEMERDGRIRLQPAVPDDPTRRGAFYREMPLDGTLTKGSSGVAVEALQWALTKAGFPAAIDGDFGPSTLKAVQEFQTAKSLTVDGLVGPKTWEKLKLLADEKRPREDAMTDAAAKKAAAKKPRAKKAPVKKAAAKTPPAGNAAATAGTYTVTADDADGFIAIVARCVGITDAAWSLRSSAAAAVAEHNGVAVDKVWQPGDAIVFPASIDGVRTHAIGAGEGLIAIAKGLGLGRSASAQEKVAAINAWQGATPHAGQTWFGGAA
jgi:peptidoglycan hydrolase-like protein with peptidoglycan-binding domain